MSSIFELFVLGRPSIMTLISLCLVAVLFCVWKAPKWVVYFGKLALVIAAFGFLFDWYQVCEDIVACEGDIAFSVIMGGLKVSLIAPMYGLIVYIITTIIRIIKTPRN